MKRAVFSWVAGRGQKYVAIKITRMWFRFAGNKDAVKLHLTENADGVTNWGGVFCLNGATAYRNYIQEILNACVDTRTWEIYIQRKAEIWERNQPVAEYELIFRQLAGNLGG